MSLAACRLGRRSLYLLPTREGLWFLAALFVLLLAAINYGNGLAYAATFLLGATATLSAAQSQRNLLDITIHESLPRPAFAGSPVGFRIILVNPGSRPRFGVTVTGAKGFSTTVDLAPFERRSVEILQETTRRGALKAPVLRVTSRYPFGLLKAFSRRITLEDPAITYPRPAAFAALPGGRAGGDSNNEAMGLSHSGGGDFSDLRPFRIGENPHHIHWRAVAAGRGLLVKRFAGLADREIWLALPRGDVEEGLARLCRQALDAEKEGYRYGLDLGRTPLSPNAGRIHLERCLQTLALYDG